MLPADNVKPIFTSVVPADNKSDKASPSMPPFDIYASGVGHGWYGLVLPIIDEINLYNEKHPENEIKIERIYQKYGTLRFNTSGSPDYINGMISIAEEESGHICEICGARGEVTEINEWLSALCEHHKKAKKESGHDHRLAQRLYKKAMHKYEQSLWHSADEFNGGN